MVRNALDHGIETPEKRQASGKDETGNFCLKAYHEGSDMLIEISDDGKGIDHKKIFEKASSLGITNPDKDYSKEDIYDLIFHPGFSTADNVTDISGRGVGMDVVRQNIEKLRGSVYVSSELGKGTKFKIKLPLTTAIIDGLIVSCNKEIFVIPSTSVHTALQATKDQISTLQGAETVLSLRDQIIPIIRLDEKLGLGLSDKKLTQGIILIIESDTKTYGLFIDAMLNKQEVVIKNLGPLFQSIEGVAGGAILGDGNIALIIDPTTISLDEKTIHLPKLEAHVL